MFIGLYWINLNVKINYRFFVNFEIEEIEINIYELKWEVVILLIRIK